MEVNNKIYFEKKNPENYINDKKELIIGPLSYNKSFNKKKILKYKIFTLTLIIIIIFLIIYILIISKKLNESEYFRKLYKIFRADFDIKLFLKNKTEFYYMNRRKFLKNKYNESYIKTFQDKLNYLVIHESPEYKSNIVDKIKLSEYSKKILGKDICIPILKIYNNLEEINLNELPDKFVLKCNHGSEMNIFCKDKSKFDLEQAKKQLNKWMNTNYGLLGFEFQYIFC